MTSTVPTPAELIGNMTYFRQLPPAEINGLARHARFWRGDKGDAIFREGEPARGLYYLVKGRVQAVRHSPEGRRLIVREFSPGETFNEVGALDAVDNAATAVANEDGTKVLLIPGEQLRSLSARYPDLSQKIMLAMAEKLRYAMTSMNRLAFMDVKARLCAHLLEAAGPDQVLHDVSQEQLAGRLGTVRQVVGRALQELQAAGSVQVQRGRIKVLDRAALHKLAR